MELECLTCKKHYSQGGDCWEHKRNCLYYDKEPRGKMMRTTFSFEMISDAENTLIKQGEKLIINYSGKEIEITIIKINWVEMENMVCNVTGMYHENEEPMHEKIKKFRVVRK